MSLSIVIIYKTIHCDRCGIIWAMPDLWMISRKKNHETFWCPNCRSPWHFPKETDEERLKRLLKQKERQLNDERKCCEEAYEEVNKIERKYWGMKGYANKIKKQLKEKKI